MATPNQIAGLVSVLETDLRQLAHDARKSEGFASFFSNADNQPEVKEAADRAVMKVRSYADHPAALDQIRNCKEILKPLQLACDTKSARLITQALSTVQKLVSNEALSPSGANEVVYMLVKVEKVNDEGVQLKLLQTALTLLQSQLHPTSEDEIGTVLSVCFRALTQKGRKDTVTSTAAATVRQAVALVFTYVDVPAEVARLDRLQAKADAGNEQQPAAVSGEPAVLIDPLASDADAPSPALVASQRLLEDLIAIATGVAPSWVKTPSLPRTLTLEVLDFALSNSADLFRALPDFESTLSLRISQLLQSQLQDYLDAGAAGAQLAASEFPAFKATLKCVRTLLLCYHPQLGSRCVTLIQTMLRGLSSSHPLQQRIAVGQLMRQLLADPSLVYYLFVTYDLHKERKLDAVHALIKGASEVIDAALKDSPSVNGGNKDASSIGVDSAAGADAIGALFESRAVGKDWALDTDYESAPPATQQTYLAVLAMDSLLRFMGSVERLTEAATAAGGSGASSSGNDDSNMEVVASPRSAQQLGLPVGLVDRETCCNLIDRTWRSMLSVLSRMLERCQREVVVLTLLKGYQGFTQACGVLDQEEPRDAFLGALCDLALSGEKRRGRELEFQGHHGSPRRADSGSPPARKDTPASPPASRRTASADMDDAGLVLTPKNVQAMRTLFNIAHRLANNLGAAGWALVLDTLDTLDRVLHSPKTTTQDAGSGGIGSSDAASGVSSDLAILSAAASQLFECTRDMSREAVVALLSALRDVSLRHLPHATQVSQPKMFALGRMVEVLVANVHRIFDLWAIFLSHVLELVADPKPPVRTAAIDALGRAIVGALSSLPPSVPGVAPADSTGGLEHMLLVALEALHNDERERDVRIGVLRVLLLVLQRHGERLTDGWTPVFRLLAVVPGQGDPETVSLGFQSVQLVCSDYMSAMPFPRLKKCLEVAIEYGKQQADVNVSLTAISLLWNTGDMLGRSRTTGGDVGSRSEDRPSKQETITHTKTGSSEHDQGEADDDVADDVAGGQRHLVAVTTPALAEELLELIFFALQGLSQDPRPEVRNSGARTLFAVVVTQGPRLSRGLWEMCLWEMLFPLLRHAFHMSATSSKEESEATLLGKSRGEQVRLVMHHSRNTEQKQWDETVVVAVGGMARLLRAHLPAIAAMEGMDGGWEELMMVAEGSLAGGRKEVALAAISLLGGVLGAHGGDDTVVTPAMWRRAMRAVDVGVEAATSGGCQVPLSARTEMVGLISSLYGTPALRVRFTPDDTRAVFRWAEAFCRNPWSEDDASNVVQTIGMPPVQKAALALLPTLTPDHAPELWPEYVRAIVRLVRPEHVLAAWREQEAVSAAAAALALASSTSGEGSAGVNAAMNMNSSPQRLPTAPQGLGGTPGPPGTGTSGAVHMPSKQAQHRYALNSAFLEKVLDQLVEIYDRAPLTVRAVTLADIAQALGQCMELRYFIYQEKLWRAAAVAFNVIVPIGVAAVGSMSSSEGPEAVADAARSWLAVAGALENFLLGDSFQKVHLGTVPPPAARPTLRRMSSDSGGPAPLQHPSGGPAGGGTDHPHLPVVPILDVPKSKNTATASSQNSKQRRGGKAGKSKEASGAQQHTHDSQGSAAAAAAAAPPIDPQQGRADAELELSVLDCLTDGVLTACGPAPLPTKRRLISIVDRGVVRPRELSIPQATTFSNFSHVCVRKMYVLCSRGDSGEPGKLQVARLALPLFLARCDGMLRGFAEETRPGTTGDGPPVERPRLDEIMCVLEVLASMSLAPGVVDAALPQDEPVTAVVAALRQRPEVAARGRERTHLLLLYSALCGCVTCKEPRVREMIRDVLGLAGAELGLGAPLGL